MRNTAQGGPSRQNAPDARLTMLLRIVADDQTADVVITDRNLTWLSHPYDGGPDLIAATPADPRTQISLQTLPDGQTLRARVE